MTWKEGQEGRSVVETWNIISLSGEMGLLGWACRLQSLYEEKELWNRNRPSNNIYLYLLEQKQRKRRMKQKPLMSHREKFQKMEGEEGRRAREGALEKREGHLSSQLWER